MEQEKAERPPAPHKCNPFTVVWKKNLCYVPIIQCRFKTFCFWKIHILLQDDMMPLWQKFSNEDL